MLSESHMTFSSQPHVFRNGKEGRAPGEHTRGLQWSLYLQDGLRKAVSRRSLLLFDERWR